MTETCSHSDKIKVFDTEVDVCAKCVAQGDSWVHLRLCMECGEVNCCEDSKNQHALKHFHETGHPIVKALPPNRAWSYCYEDQSFVKVSPPAGGNES